MSYYCEIKGLGFVYAIQDGCFLLSLCESSKCKPLRLPLSKWEKFEDSGMFDDVPSYSFSNNSVYTRN